MSNAIQIQRVRFAAALLLAALAFAVAGLSAPSALATPPASWEITMKHLNLFGAQASQCEPSHHAEPTAEEPCGVDPLFETQPTDKGEEFARESLDQYILTVKNVGSGPSSGPVTVTDTLPEGMTIVPSLSKTAGWTCTNEAGKGGHKLGAVTCVTSAALAPGSTYPTITVSVSVEKEAGTKEQPVVNAATVKGGGATPEEASTTPEEGKTTVLPAVPFGVSKLATRIFREPNEPFAEGLKPKLQCASPGSPKEPGAPCFGEAGGHPFAVQTEIVMNYTTGLEVGPAVVAAGGGAKEINADLPPGFLGNVLSTPQCPIPLLFAGRCPTNTAVGYAQVTLNAAEIGKGRLKPFAFEEFQIGPTGTSSLIYNLEPPPGTPAAFGFVAGKGVPFVLDSRLRSDGDYGVTVGDNAVGQKPVASRLTFCANGSHFQEGASTGSLCNPVPPDGTPDSSPPPFFTLPTACLESSSTFTVHTSPWLDPEKHVPTVTHTSALEGCENLTFHPSLEFKPGTAAEGGTTMADEPTGVTVGLKVPQPTEVNKKGEPTSPPALKEVEMTLPKGMSVNPGGADGLKACAPAQFWPSARAENEEAEGRTPAAPSKEEQEEAEKREPAVAAKCPSASQVGTVEVFTPLLSGAPTIQNVPQRGELLNCTKGEWSVTPEQIFYQWLRNGSAIKGATGAHYTPSAQDEGALLQCEVTARNVGGSSIAVSRTSRVGVNNAGAVSFEEPGHPTPFPSSSIPAPTGTASSGHQLSCARANWRHIESPEPEYRWLHGGVEISGATSATYTLTPEDEGKAVQCQQIGKGEGREALADSPAVTVASVVSATPPPLPGAALQGNVFVAQPGCSPCGDSDAESGNLLRLYLQVQDPVAGLIVKVHGSTIACTAQKAVPACANQEQGQLITKFENQPQTPFELLQLKLKGGPRAPLANPQTCGPAVVTSRLVPWSAARPSGHLQEEEEAAAKQAQTPSAEFNVEGCAANTPFNPSFNAGTFGSGATTAAAFTQFSLTFSREDREQDLSGVEVKMPLGLAGLIASVKQCGDAEVQAAEQNKGECPAESQVGTATAGAGPGPHPFFQQGKVYLTGPYKGAPFGLAVVTPAVAGPFNLGNIVVRSTINVNPVTAAVTAVSDPLPQFRDGLQLRIRRVNVEVNRPGFLFNPTNCNAQTVAATLTSTQGGTAHVSSPFGMRGCASLPFAPTLSAAVDAQGSKANGIGFHVKLTSAGLGVANISKVFVTVPKILPARLQPTLQHACLEAAFNSNPASCPEQSVIGIGTVHTPVFKNPLSGPAYIVSHGNAAFPDVEFVLQGEGVTIVIDGKTDIKKGITYSRFEASPDAPFTTFETNFPAGPHSIFTANTEIVPDYNLCGQTIALPTELTGQNGKVLKQENQVTVEGCQPSVSITGTKLKGKALLVTLKTRVAGKVTITGSGLKQTTATLAAGTNQVRVPLTKTGLSLGKHHKRTRVKAKLTVEKAVVTTTASARL
jgi:uncharacterized repeat protein (TIGR01451 family)